MPQKIVQTLSVLLAIVFWGNAFAEISGEHDAAADIGKIINLPENYDFGQPKVNGENISPLWIETVQLLNNSVWEPQSQSAPLPIDKAIDRAIQVLSTSEIKLRKTQLQSCKLYPLLFDAAENVWVYEIFFDSAAHTPFSEGRRLMNLHRAVVLMDGSAYTSGVQSIDAIQANFRQMCSFKKERGLWRLGQCVSK